MGGRLQNYWKQWKQIGASDYVVNILRYGLTLEFKEPPPMTKIPQIKESYQNDPISRKALEEAVEELLNKRVLEEVEQPNSPGYYGRLFLQPKKETNKWRTIIDLSDLNEFIVNPSFQMESPKTIQAAMRKDLWCTSVDLKDAYFHILIHKTYLKYMRVALLGKVLQFRALPMGLNISARIFTKIILEVVRYLRIKGIYTSTLIHRRLVTEKKDPALLQQQTLYVLKLCAYLELLVNMIKSEINPGQARKYVGIIFDLKQGLAIAAPNKLLELEIILKKIIKQ